MRCVPGITVSEVVLNDSQVVPLVRQGETAGMAKHMWVDALEPGTGPGGSEDVVYGLPRERLLALGDEAIPERTKKRASRSKRK